MKKLETSYQSLLFIWVLLFASCSNPIKKDSGEIGQENTKDSSAKNTIVKDNEVDVSDNSDCINYKITDSLQIDTTLSNEIPLITPLPFGPLIDKLMDLKKPTFFYTDLVGKDYYASNRSLMPTYKLPPIDKVKYLIIDKENEISPCSNTKSEKIGDWFKIRKYRYRLPDKGKFQVYYMPSDENAYDDFKSSLPEECCGAFLCNTYGYLILYDTLKREARLLSIFHSCLGDAVNSRRFYIDKNYNIFLLHQIAVEGNDQADIYYGPYYQVEILDDGELSVEVSQNSFDNLKPLKASK